MTPTIILDPEDFVEGSCNCELSSVVEVWMCKDCIYHDVLHITCNHVNVFRKEWKNSKNILHTKQ